MIKKSGVGWMCQFFISEVAHYVQVQLIYEMIQINVLFIYLLLQVRISLCWTL